MDPAENPKRTPGNQPDHFYHRPLLPLLLAFIAGIVLARFFPSSELLYRLAIPFAAGAAVCLLYLLARSKPARLSPLVLFFALGGLAHAPWQAPFFPPDGALSHLEADYANIRATITGPPQSQSFRTKCILDDLTVESKAGGPHSLQGRIQAAFYGDCPELLPGDRVAVHGRLREFRNFNNPGGFDYRRFMADRNIWGALYAEGKYVDILSPSNARDKVFSGIHCFRNRLDGLIEQVSSGETASVLSALIVGKKDGIDPELREAFNRSGASHLLAISGLHVGIVATCAFFLFKWLLSWCPPLLLRGWAGKCAALLTIFPVVAYGMLSGMSPSTQRAMIMVLVFLAALIRDKPYDPANTLAAAALCILAVRPPGLFSVSFQLSFAAVSAIFFGLYLFSGVLRPAGPPVCPAARLAYRIRAFMLISVFAIGGTLPLVLHYFNQAAITGVFSNLILVPWIGFVVVPAGLVSAGVSAFSSAFGTWCFSLAAQILQPAISLVHTFAGLPFGAFRTVTPTVLEAGCAYAIAACGGLMFFRRYQQDRKLLFIIICALVIIIAADAGYWLNRRFFHTDLRATVLDVGQGHASLLEFPGGRTMLIDGGGFSDNSVFDVGARIMAPYLWQNKIRNIDTVVLSHPDADHLNGLLFILEKFRVRRVISAYTDAQSAACQQFDRIIRDRQIPHPDFERIRRTNRINDGAEIRILYPEQNRKTRCAKCPGTNNCSIVVKVSYRDRSVLFPGDLEKCAESELIKQAARDMDADILIAPHHGSKSSSGRDFIAAVDPDTVIIPVRQSYQGLPSPEVVERYRQQGSRVLRTDIHGAVRIGIDSGGGMEIQPTIGGK
ncbi:MAG: DNA internalization-related competence protein ComEC/Rec2 [Desulfobacterales bacterium]|nr:DNA internalization-related competence protein ComEC/Rec2 [Desulfobacterales bacterium]